MSEATLDILTLVGFIGVCIIGAAIVTFINRMQKVKTVCARVVKKEIMNPGITSQVGVPKCRIHFAIYDGSNKKTVKYKVSEKCYARIPQTASGKLMLRGSELISFSGDDFSVEF